MLSEGKFIALVRELTADNRHTTAMRFVARRFGFEDLRKTFAGARVIEKRERQTTDEAVRMRTDAYHEMRSRIVFQHGAKRWMRIPL